LASIEGKVRYDAQAKDGISVRWLPGTQAAATWNAQADEHNGDGSIDESGANATAQMEKRMKKQAALLKALLEPELYGADSDAELDVLLVGWGSTKGSVLDVLESEQLKGKKIGYLHYTYLWPLKTELFQKLHAKAKKTVLVEGTYMGQLGILIAQTCGVVIEHKILRYDGRPFFYDDLLAEVASHASLPLHN
jgi:2-oxoglutarate/2-oxoacid ferredoxin oxidoreductase subunit alpha